MIPTNKVGAQVTDAVIQPSEDSRLKLALDAAQLGTWERNLLTGEDIWSERQEALFGLAPGAFDSQPSFIFGSNSSRRPASS